MSFDIRISGTSVASDVDTGVIPIKVASSNSDQIGYATFALQNINGKYSKIVRSGAPTVEIDLVSGGTRFRGTIERIDSAISVQQGGVVICHAYDKGQELLNNVSPDARQPFPDIGGVLTSGDQGIVALDGLDLTTLVSGVSALSGVTVASLMSQFYGTETDPSGSFSGRLASFKPHISGYTYDTWYKPDGSPDNNVNYWVPLDTFKVRREYAWDSLRRLTRGNIAIDVAGNRVPFELYIGVSGDIHIFTSGSTEFLASGTNGQVTLIYYEAGQSGSQQNNVLQMSIPFDSTSVKNRMIGWFPRWTRLPVDGDSYTDFVAYSGALWSGTAAGGTTTISGNTPSKSGIGNISIMATNSHTPAPGENKVSLIYTVKSGSLNIDRFRGYGSPLTIEADMRVNHSGTGIQVCRHVAVYDTSGNFIIKSGSRSILTFPNFTGGFFTYPESPNSFDTPRTQWAHVADTIYDQRGIFNSGTGLEGGWAASATFPDLTRVRQILMGFSFIANQDPSTAPTLKEVSVDNLYFGFNYVFSPVVAFNSGSQGMYKRRYAVFEYPYTVMDIQASGIIAHELNAKMGSKQVAEAIIKDNPNLLYSAQRDTKPGQVVRIDAPTLNTGSGQTFDYWRIISLEHEFSVQNGFVSRMRLVPWTSGTLVDPNTNLVDFTLPYRYTPIDSPVWTPSFMWVGGLKQGLVPISSTDNQV